MSFDAAAAAAVAARSLSAHRHAAVFVRLYEFSADMQRSACTAHVHILCAFLVRVRPRLAQLARDSHLALLNVQVASAAATSSESQLATATTA